LVNTPSRSGCGSTRPPSHRGFPLSKHFHDPMDDALEPVINAFAITFGDHWPDAEPY
jgi:hypothetical protein